MRNLVVFNQMSLDGYVAGPDGDIGWAYSAPEDAEWNAFVRENASGGGALVFGRVTYEMMAGYWPTPMAASQNPSVAERMNAMPKIVFSTTLTEASWSNTTLLRGDLVARMRALKHSDGPDMAILGSASIAAQCAAAGLIDQYQVVVNPVALGAGTTMFEGLGRQLALSLTSTRAFGNGKVLLCYTPAG